MSTGCNYDFTKITHENNGISWTIVSQLIYMSIKDQAMHFTKLIFPVLHEEQGKKVFFPKFLKKMSG